MSQQSQRVECQAERNTIIDCWHDCPTQARLRVFPLRRFPEVSIQRVVTTRTRNWLAYNLATSSGLRGSPRKPFQKGPCCPICDSNHCGQSLGGSADSGTQQWPGPFANSYWSAEKEIGGLGFFGFKSFFLRGGIPFKIAYVATGNGMK